MNDYQRRKVTNLGLLTALMILPESIVPAPSESEGAWGLIGPSVIIFPLISIYSLTYIFSQGKRLFTLVEVLAHGERSKDWTELG